MRDLYEKPFDEGGRYRGLQTVETEAFVATVRDLNRRGWRVATHAVGDAAIDLVLEGLRGGARGPIDRRADAGRSSTRLSAAPISSRD